MQIDNLCMILVTYLSVHHYCKKKHFFRGGGGSVVFAQKFNQVYEIMLTLSFEFMHFDIKTGQH